MIEQFPHCDSLVLHKPGICSYCDEHPDWQELRLVWGINFTGETDPNKTPCPSASLRHHRTVHAWPGNRPTRVSVPMGPMSVYDQLKEDDE